MSKIKSIYGLDRAVIAPIISDTESGTIYGAVEPITGAIDASITPGNTDPEIQYADNDEFDVLYPDPEIAVAVELTALPLSVQASISGHVIDANGVMAKKAGDTPPYYALGFRGKRRDGGDRYTWLLKGRAKPVAEQYHTTEGKTVTRQTGKVEFTFIKRSSDGLYQFSADLGLNGFTSEKAATFLATVYGDSASSTTILHTLTWNLTAPVKSATPAVTMNGTGYTGIVQWSPAAPAAFAASTAYTATVTLTASAGYMFNPYLTMGGIASLPVGATAVRLDDRTIRIVHTYAATVA